MQKVCCWLLYTKVAGFAWKGRVSENFVKTLHQMILQDYRKKMKDDLTYWCVKESVVLTQPLMFVICVISKEVKFSVRNSSITHFNHENSLRCEHYLEYG